MAANLEPGGNPVKVGNVVLRTPGLAGVAESHLPGTPEMRAAELSTEEFDAALAAGSLQTQETVELAGTQEVDAGAAVTRSTSYGEPAMVVEAPDPGAEWGQLILYTDEAGVTTWNFARTEAGAIDVSRATGPARTYVLRRLVAPAGVSEARGLIGAIGKKLIKVLAFPLIDPVAGAVSDFFVTRWEAKNRPYRLRTFTPDDYASRGGTPLDDAAWAKLAEGPALLMVHGTFSLSNTGFGSFPRAFVETLHQRYGGRVVAFDHPSVSVSPAENVAWLIEHMPAGAQLHLDMIGHSRGGLVARVLAEKQGELSLGGRSVTVERVVFAGTPNGGTVLSDAAYFGDLIDSYTNLLNFFPDTGVLEVLDGVIAVAKQLAVGAAKGLEGIGSMVPGGTYLAGLNQGAAGPTAYFALAADYEPPDDASIKLFAKDHLLDRVFKAGNDLVVPTDGVFDTNGAGAFPITNRHVFEGSDRVQHNGFFRNPTAQEQILAWLAR